MDTKRSAERRNEMEGTVEDLKKIEGEGLEGHEGSGADIKFVSKEKQKQRKEAEVKDIDRIFAEYINKYKQLVTNKEKLNALWLGDIQTNTYPQNYLQKNIAREIAQNPGKAQGYYEKIANGQFLVCYIDQTGNLYKIEVNFSKLPGAEEGVQSTGYAISFLYNQLIKIGCDHNKVGQGSSFTGYPEVTLKKMFLDLESVKS